MKKLIIFALFVLFIVNGYAEDPDIMGLNEVKSLRDSGNTVEAKKVAFEYLEKYPHHPDFEYLLALMYHSEKNDAAAKALLEDIINRYPHYADAKDLLGKITGKVLSLSSEDDYVLQAKYDMGSGKYQEAVDVADEGLKKFPNSPKLNLMKAKAYYEMKDYKNSAASARETLSIDPDDEVSISIIKDVSDSYPKYAIGPNVIGLYQQSLYATSPDDYWDFTNLYYVRDMDFGALSGAMNYASRYGHNSIQGVIEGYFILNKFIYVDLSFGYADNLYVFPNYQPSVEVFFQLPDDFQLSGGFQYNNINPTYFNRYTVSLQKTTDLYWFEVRPYHYTPQTGGTSTYVTGTARRKINDEENHFVGVTVGFGQTPDLADLFSVDFLILKNKYAGINYEFPVANKRYILDIGFSYNYQLFPSGKVREITGLNFGVRKRY